MDYFTGNGWGVSKYVDLNGIPLLSYTFPKDGKTITLFDRVAVKFDPTIKRVTTLDTIYSSRLDVATSSAIKKALAGTADEELDHKISLELGGSNEFSNLGLNPPTGGSVINQTDTFENQLSAAVQSGAISLFEAWRKIAAAKSFVLAEDMQIQKNNAWSQAAQSVLGAIQGLIGTKQLGTLNTNLLAQIKQDGDQLAVTPYNIDLRHKIFTEQINLTAQQLNLSPADTAAYTKVYTAQYVTAKGQDPREVLGALKANEQQLLNIAGVTPNILGISNAVWSNVAAALTVGQSILLGISAISAIIAIFTVGPEVVAALSAAGTLTEILGVLGVSTSVAVAGGAFVVAEVLGAIASRIPMITKQLADNTYIIPSLISTALNDDIKNIKAQGGGGTSKAPSTSGLSTGFVSPSIGSRVQVYTGIVSQGRLGQDLVFTPRPAGIIESMSDLQSALQNNLAPYLAALPSKLIYDVKITPHIVDDTGLTQRGTTQKIIRGYTKKGVAEYKTVTNKYAVLDIYVLTDKGNRTKITSINLGPTDAAKLRPSAGDLNSLSGAVASTVHTTNTDNISSVVSNTPTTSTPPTQVPQTPTVIATQPAQPSGAPAGFRPSFIRNNIQYYTANDGNVYNIIGQRLDGNTLQLITQTQTQGGGTQTASTPPPQPAQTTSQAKGATAQTLLDWYTQNGYSLPATSVLGLLYQDFGYGPQTLYVGSNEQNAQILAGLKKQAG